MCTSKQYSLIIFLLTILTVLSWTIISTNATNNQSSPLDILCMVDSSIGSDGINVKDNLFMNLVNDMIQTCPSVLGQDELLPEGQGPIDFEVFMADNCPSTDPAFTVYCDDFQALKDNHDQV